MDAFGGRRGVLDSGLPPLTFISAYLVSGSNLTAALVAALVAGLVVTGWRLATHDTLRHALAGFGAVALAAFVASRTGRPQDYFLPSLLSNAGAALAWAVSIWVKRPFLGLVVGGLTRSSAWRTDPVMLAAYCRASWIWVGSFLVRVAVMTPLWLAGHDRGARPGQGGTRLADGAGRDLAVLARRRAGPPRSAPGVGRRRTRARDRDDAR